MIRIEIDGRWLVWDFADFLRSIEAVAFFVETGSTSPAAPRVDARDGAVVIASSGGSRLLELKTVRYGSPGFIELVTSQAVLTPLFLFLSVVVREIALWNERNANAESTRADADLKRAKARLIEKMTENPEQYWTGERASKLLGSEAADPVIDAAIERKFINVTREDQKRW